MQRKINQANVIEGEEEFRLQHMTPSCPQKPIIPPCLLGWGNFTFPPECFHLFYTASSKSNWAKSHWWSSPGRPFCHITMRILYQPPSSNVLILYKKNDVPSREKNRRKQGCLTWPIGCRQFGSTPRMRRVLARPRPGGPPEISSFSWRFRPSEMGA